MLVERIRHGGRERNQVLSRRQMFLLLLNLVSGDVSTHLGKKEVPHSPSFASAHASAHVAGKVVTQSFSLGIQF